MKLGQKKETPRPSCQTRGMSKKEIAEVIHLAVKTVERHCCNLMDKLDIHDRVGLARYAIREGIV